MSHPPKRGVAAAVLFPGAGTGAEHPGLVAIAEALAPLPVRLQDFGYRLRGRKAPDRAPKLVAEVVAAATDLAAEHDLGTEHLVLGGRSMGARMCSLAVAEGLPVAGLILVAYPLHPPGRPDRLRAEHLERIEAPCLFASGTRDPFGTREELEAATASVPGPVTHLWIEGARHELAGADDLIAAEVACWVAALTPGSPPGSPTAGR